jgi:hypothetical protein
MKPDAAAAKITAFSVGAFLLSATALFADSIAITGGALVATLENAAHLDVRGSNGFRLRGAGDFHGGRFEPWGQCFHASDCAPGRDISLFASWSGSDFTGSVTMGGTTYPLGIITEENFSAAVEFTGSVTAPAFDGRILREVSAPFAFSGTLIPPATPDQGPPWQLTGKGTATLRLSWSTLPFDQGWRFDRAVYAFDTANPIPEPGSIVLLGIGLSGFVGHRLRRRHV